MTTKKIAKKANQKSASKAAANADNYTDPALREKIKDEVMRGNKGGKPDQWSARKAQLVAYEYEAQGGGYKHPPNEAQQHLKAWGDEKWHTAEGTPAVKKDATSRYLPDQAWDQLTPAEKKATDAKKQAASRTGKQYVPNTAKAKAARKRAAK